MDFRARRLGAYAVLYLVWGSTYLAMRFAVETLPPLSLAGTRFLLAGAVLFAWALARGDPRPTKRDWLHAAAVSVFLMIGGNALVLWALRRVPSGAAALVIATTPLWLALLGAVRPSRRTALGIALGLCGVGALVGPAAFAGAGRIDPWGGLLLLGASLSWSIGSLLQRRGTSSSPLLATGLQMLTGGAMLFCLALVFGEFEHLDQLARASARSWAALVYLTLFGSLLGFTSYTWLLRHDEPTRVATYTYVNPIVAIFLGSMLGGEELSWRVGLATVVIVGGVAVILGERRR